MPSCHVINLCVKCAFDDFLGTVIEKFKVCGKLLRERRYGRDWKQLCISSGVRFKKFPQPIETRWKSLYHLLSTLLRFKDLVTPFYNNIAAEAVLLTESDWDVLTQCVSLLKIFKEAIEKFSGIHYPTAPMFLSLIFNMFFKIIEFRENPHLHFFVSSMEDKFFKYWETIPLVHGLAALLDPSQGQVAFDIFFDYYAKFLGKNVDAQKKSIMHSLQQLFNLCANEQSTPRKQPEPEERSTQQGKMGALGFYRNFKRQNFKGKSVTRLNSNEIQLYLSQYFETLENFDVLEWWKVNSQLYLILATIARDILHVQASSVASESAFSMCG
ncbi:zinc finger BED domain-containing protein RICESLEEPER 2-like [Dorcoceras hygrometricum]|uniref:Zinc finger BED domain-containing protein RICESLEEPER 2-like n=1 Tax=Dorcoceras hygrometricum TaxID=472368 RepID=A0A2Z7D292_9LAMI|nr:zinc finger BED domain-containing protein RICESLEEPER 2-like [Dorcoceras hygrometricum]